MLFKTGPKKVRLPPIDNKKVNSILTIPFLVGTWFIAHHYEKNLLICTMQALVATIVYHYASWNYSPDLDLRAHKPGVMHFPLGAWAARTTTAFKLLRIVFLPVNIYWRIMWHEYGKLVTHRGITHWPLIGTILRALWIYAWMIPFTIGINYIGCDHGMQIQGIIPNATWINALLCGLQYIATDIRWWCISHLPFSEGFGSQMWYITIAPIFVSDLAHVVVDYHDSNRNGFSFCPPRLPRGLFARMIRKVF